MKSAIIIGGGPAGLTAALELLDRTDIRPIVIEKSEYMGGISRTVNYKGNRIDIGGHRFFSKSDRVMEWWLKILPLEGIPEGSVQVSYHNQNRFLAASADGPDPEREDRVMLIRNRLSRIYFMRRFFDYPIRLSGATLKNLGLLKVVKVGASYVKASMFPRRNERSLEDFLINRFGRELYLTFFKSYTEKVWGEPCDKISAEWGAQRIKGLSIYKALAHLVKSAFHKNSDLSQKQVETSLIEKFLYPKFGPGQMWEEVAQRIRARGGEICTGWAVDGIETDGQGRVQSLRARNVKNGETRCLEGDYFFSTMPIQELVNSMTPAPADEIREIANGLMYRDFITVGLLCNKLKLTDRKDSSQPVKDNWIYIQEPDVQVGRMQIFNNWSPYMVADPSKVWIGLEYFCYDTDSIWSQSDSAMTELATRELDSMQIVDPRDVLDSTVIRMPKTYPAYFGAYDRFPKVIEWANGFENLFLIGRNGMHKYNNQDHSMLAAMTAVDCILAGERSRDKLWSLNTEMEYHEQKSE
jgi:protoporphyrinogen oxidase